MGKWRKTTLVGFVRKGSMLTSANMQDGEFPVVAGGLDYAGFHNSYNRKEKCITVSASGANAGAVKFHKTKIFATDCSTVEWNGDQEYLFYELLRWQQQIFKMQSGLAQPHVYPKDLEKIEIYYPYDILEQRKIAEILATLDEVIDSSRTLIDKYNNIKTGMMQDLLGNLDDEKHEKFPMLGNVQIINGGTPSTQNNDYWNGNIGWLSVEDINTGHRYVYSTQKKITEAGLKNSSTAILKTGQIIISARGTVGVVAQMGNDLTFNQSCYGLNSVLYWTNDFLYYYLLFISDKIRSITHGNVFGTIIKDTFKDIFIPLIPKSIQNNIVDALSSVDIKIEAERDYLAKLQDIKKGLMKDLLTNTINVESLL